MKHKVTLILASLLVLAFGVLQYQIISLKTPGFGATIPTVVALFETSLASKITSSATSATLVTGTDKQGNSLSGTYGFIIDEGSANEEFVICTASGTALSSCTRGISVTDGKTAVAALQKEHRRGATVKITNYPQLAILSRILNGQETIPNRLAYQTHPTFSGTAASTSLITKKYADDLSIAGATNATTTVQGLVEQATVAELNAGTGTGGTGARLFFGPSEWASSSFGIALQGTAASVSATNKVLSRRNIWASTITSANKLLSFTLTSSAQGDVLYRNSAGNYVNLPLGTAGYNLIASASGNPQWRQAPSQVIFRSVSGPSGDVIGDGVKYAMFGSSASASASASVSYGFQVPFSGRLTNFRVRMGDNAPNTNELIVSIDKNDVITALSITFNSGTANTTSVDTDSVAVSAGDRIRLRLNCNTCNDAGAIMYSVELRAP